MMSMRIYNYVVGIIFGTSVQDFAKPEHTSMQTHRQRCFGQYMQYETAVYSQCIFIVIIHSCRHWIFLTVLVSLMVEAVLLKGKLD